MSSPETPPTPPPRRLLEVCVDSVEGAIAAEAGGAHRLELCAGLLEGGVTPSSGTLALARAAVRLPIHVIIRPRDGDFLYSAVEVEAMRRDVESARAHGADGVVIGCLTEEGDVDLTLARELIEQARPLSVTFHRAFDMARDPAQALEALVALGVDRILTSGQERTAGEGAELIGALVERAAGRVTVMPGGGISEQSLPGLIARTGAVEFHASARTRVGSRMRHWNPRVRLGPESGEAAGSRLVTDRARVAALARILREA